MRWKNLILTLAAIPALCLLQSCDAGKEETLMNDLTEGYWREEQDENKLLVRFSGSESLFYYACSGPDKTGRYDAYYDTSIQSYTQYAIDVRNGRLCLLPDAWYDILVLNSTTLTLGTDDGETVKFIKVPAASVTVMSREDYLDKHPETRPEN